MVMGTGIKDTHTALLYELAFTVMHSVTSVSSEVKQRRARLVVVRAFSDVLVAFLYFDICHYKC